MTTKRELYEILKDLSSEELEDFNLNVELERGVQPLSKHHPKGKNAEEVVELMVEKYSEESVELTKNVLKKMNRTDLVQRLSDSNTGSKEKHSVPTETKQWPSLIQRVEMITSDIEVLMDVLADMTEGEIGYFRNFLKQTPIKRNKSFVSWWQPLLTGTHRVFVGGHQETVFLLIMTCGQHSVKTTKGILKKMKRTDLLQRLTDARLKKKESDEQRSALIQKVATMSAVQQLLLETLHCLSQRELSEFKELHELIQPSLSMRRNNEIQYTVDQMMMTCGRQSVELTREVLKEMNRTDLIQMLSESSSALEEKHSVDGRLKLLEEAVKEDAEWILLQMLRSLSFKELEKFRFLLKFTYFQRSLPQIHTEPAHQLEELVYLMVKNQHPVEVTKEVLMDMNRSDLVERLSGTSSGLKEKSSLDCLLTVKTATASVIELLMETLADLSEEEIDEFMAHLECTWGVRYTSYSPWLQRKERNHQETVFSVIMTCSKHSVEITREILKEMKKTDLVQRLSDCSSTHKKKESDKQHSALIQKVATMSAVQQLLLETLHCLSQRELSEFKEFLKQIVSKKKPIPIASVLRPGGERAEIVDLMMRTYGQRSVELTREVLEEMNRADLIQMLSGSSSALTDKHSIDERQPLFPAEAVKEDDEQILCQTLKGLGFEELEKFSFLLQFTYFHKSLPQVVRIQTEPEHKLEDLVYLMVENQQPVEVTKEVLMDMKRSDLVERLSEISSGLKGEGQSEHLQKKPSSLCWTVFEALTGLSSREFKLFKDLWHTGLEKGLPEVRKNQITRASRARIAKLMVEIHGQRCVEVTADVLKKLKETDLVRKTILVGKPSGTSSGLKTWEEHQSKRLQGESTLTADHEQLLEILEKLSPGELEKFKHVLQYTKLRGLPKIPGHSMETADKAETVRLMVENYGQQSVDVTKDVLEILRRMDLVEKLSESSSGSQGPSGSLEPEACGGSTTDSSPWTKLEPGVNGSGGDESPTYSLQSETGNYECSVSGLRWVCEEEVSFQYHFCSWGGHMERMESIKYMPAGPLMDIKVITGRLNEVHLPHWICTEDDSKISDNFKVLHIDECGDVVENVSEVTPSHVKLSEPVFSPRGVLIRAGFPVKTRCNMLLYKSNTAFFTLHAYLTPCDPGLQQETDKKELKDGYQVIRKPHPEKALKMRDRFILTADVDGAEIYPEDIKLRYEWGTPNFFEVFIENPDGNIILKLANKKEGTPVWICALRRVEYQTTGHPQDIHFVDKHMIELINRVSNIAPILDELLSKGVIQQEQYGDISSLPTSQKKIRALYDGCLRSGKASKDIFYESLKKNEKFLIADLE